MTDQSQITIPEWLSLQDIVRMWSGETGESTEVLERRFREWFKDFLVRNAYADEAEGEAGIPPEMLEGRQIWRETFETFCEEKGYTKPRFWFQEEAERRTTEASKPLELPRQRVEPAIEDETGEDTVTDTVKAPAPEKAPPPRRRVREGGASFTWIAAALVMVVVLGLGGLLTMDGRQQVAQPDEKRQPGAEQLAASAVVVEQGSASTESPAGDASLGEARPALQTPPSVERATPLVEQPSPTATATAPAAETVVAEPTQAAAVPAPQDTTQTTAQNSSSGATRDQGQATQIATAPTASEAKEAETDGLVFLIQRELELAGFDPGPRDGQSGRRLSAAIITYQRARAIPVDGRPSVDLLAQLAGENLQRGRSAPFLVQPPPTVTEQSSVANGRTQRAGTVTPTGPQVASISAQRQVAATMPSRNVSPEPRARSLIRAIQDRLKARGYYNGPSDGDLGSGTREAIRTYQRAQRHDVTGKPSPALFEELEDYALELRGLRLFRKGDYQLAIKTYSKIVQRKPNDANAYFNRGLAYKNAGFAERAIADYNAALDLNPEHRQAYLDRGNIHYAQGLYEAAIRDYFKALRLWLDFS